MHIMHAVLFSVLFLMLPPAEEAILGELITLVPWGNLSLIYSLKYVYRFSLKKLEVCINALP